MVPDRGCSRDARSDGGRIWSQTHTSLTDPHRTEKLPRTSSTTGNTATSSSSSPPFPTGGEWDHPPLKGWPRRSTPPQPPHPHTRHHHLRHHPSPQGESRTTPPYGGGHDVQHRHSKENETSQPNSIYTIELYRGVAVLTKGQPPTPRRESGVRGVGSH
jgi:hypothetical protein